MNWPLFWALVLAFGVVIGNIMLLRHAAKLQLPKQKRERQPHSSHGSTLNPQSSEQNDQKPNTPL